MSRWDQFKKDHSLQTDMGAVVFLTSVTIMGTAIAVWSAGILCFLTMLMFSSMFS